MYNDNLAPAGAAAVTVSVAGASLSWVIAVVALAVVLFILAVRYVPRRASSDGEA